MNIAINLYVGLLKYPKVYKVLSPLLSPDPTKINVQELRDGSKLMETSIKKYPLNHLKKEILQIPVRDGSTISCVLYTPLKGEGPFPIGVHFPGGGWVLVSPSPLGEYSMLPMFDKRSEKHPWIFLDVNYRTAPEHLFPTALNDALDVFQWLEEKAESLSIDKSKVLVFGQSAGANIAAVLSVLNRDLNGLKITHQLLIVPVVDWDPNDESYISYGSNTPLSTQMMRFFYETYSGTADESKWLNPLISPLRFESLKGVASASIIAAKFDPLQSSSERYAKRLEEEGVKVEYKIMPEHHHSSFIVFQEEYKSEVERVLELVESRD